MQLAFKDRVDLASTTELQRLRLKCAEIFALEIQVHDGAAKRRLDQSKFATSKGENIEGGTDLKLEFSDVCDGCCPH